MVAPETRKAVTTARLASATLAQARGCGHLANGLLLLGIASLLLPPAGPACALLTALAIGAGLVQHYYTLRCDLDARLFAAWARQWQQPGASPDADMAAFDQALDALLGKTPPPRMLEERARAALRLFRHQLVALLVELAAILGAVAWRLLQAGMN